MLAKFWIGLAACFLLAVVFVVGVVGNARFTMPHPRAPKEKMLLTDRGAVLLSKHEERAVAPARNVARGVPKIEVLETVHVKDLGDVHADAVGGTMDMRNQA